MIREIDVLEINHAMKIIDIREPEERRDKPTVGYQFENIPMIGLMLNAESLLNKQTEYYLFCNSGNRSGQACAHLQAKGYKVINLAGGYKRLIIENGDV